MEKTKQQVATESAYKAGYNAGKRRGEEGPKFENGVDWHVLGVNCDCGQEIIPCADEAGEDIVLYERMAEYRGKKCENCSKYFRMVVEDGNMASKRAEEKHD